MNKKLVLILLLVILKNSKSMDKLIEFFTPDDVTKLVFKIGGISTGVFVLYGIGDEYYTNHIKDTEKAIKEKEALLNHQDWQNPKHQNGLKKRIAILKERLAKEQKEKTKKEKHKQEAESAVNEQKPIAILPPQQAANTQDGSHSFFGLKVIAFQNPNYNPVYHYWPKKSDTIGVFEAFPEGYKNIKKMTRVTTEEFISRVTQLLNTFSQYQKEESNMYINSNWG